MSATATEAGLPRGPRAYFSTNEDLLSAAFDHI
jgi:hypothetical protein